MPTHVHAVPARDPDSICWCLFVSAEVMLQHQSQAHIMVRLVRPPLCALLSQPAGIVDLSVQNTAQWMREDVIHLFGVWLQAVDKGMVRYQTDNGYKCVK